MRNTVATPASALRMGELVPRGQRNNKDVYVISLQLGAGLHSLRLVLISKFSQHFILVCCVFATFAPKMPVIKVFGASPRSLKILNN